MSDLPRRIADQFSDRGDRAGVWRALDAVLPTDRYLNLGYSDRYGSHLLGDPQRRLVEHVLDRLDDATPGRERGRLLDVGCGRGGPAAVAARRGYDVTGVDLVPYNLRRAVYHRPARDPPSFAVADATGLPLQADSFDAGVSVDALVYVQDRETAFAELARVLRDGGTAVVSDLVAAPGADGGAADAGDEARTSDQSALGLFAASWDMPTPATLDAHLDAVEASGLTVVDASDVTVHSVGRFRKWSRLFLWLVASPAGALVRRWFDRRGIAPEAVVRQVRAANEVLPDLRHVVVTARA